MVTYIYDAQDRRRGVIGADPDGGGSRPRAAERYTFDTESRVTKVETGTATAATEAALNAMTVAQTIDITFDTNGNKVKETISGTSGAVQVVQLAYDADNRLSCSAIRMNPAIFGSLPSSACTMGTAGTGGNDYGADRIVKNTYDANSRIIKVQTAFGATEQADEVTTVYSANGQVSWLTDAEGNQSAYQYDGHDRLWVQYYPTANKSGVNWADYEWFAYDANGNVTTRRLRDATGINYGYDNFGRMTVKDLPGSEPDATYTYDLLGRALTAVQNGQTLTFTHDALGRNLSHAGPLGTVGFTYDAAGRRTAMTYPGGTSLTVNYDYDTTGQVAAIKENGSNTLATYAYDSLGRRSSVTFGNGVVQSYSFDAAQRLSTLTSDLGGSSGDQVATFGYNPAGQIDTLSKSNDAYAWAGHYNIDRLYGSNGLNQLTATTPGSGQVSVPTLAYDTKGNLVTSGSNSYTYTSENFLVTGPSSTALSYDPVGRLYQTTGSVTTRFQYDGADMIGEYNSSNAIQRRYVHGPRTDEPILWYEGSGLSDKRYLTADERGSIVAVTDASGSVIATNTYDEYGNPGAANASISNGGRFGYTGQAWLPELGMWYYKARIYNPALGRFMQTDPIGYGDGMNWYNYVGSDPVNSTDPTGLACEAAGCSGPNGGILVRGPRRSILTSRTTGFSAGSRSIIDALRATRPGMECDWSCELNREMQAHFTSMNNVSENGGGEDAIVVLTARPVPYPGLTFCSNPTLGVADRYSPFGRVNTGRRGDWSTATRDVDVLAALNGISPMAATLVNSDRFQVAMSSPVPISVGSGWWVWTNPSSGYTSASNQGLTFRFRKFDGLSRIDIPSGFRLPSGDTLLMKETCHYR